MKLKWIVHPYSYVNRGSREISVIHQSNTHGLKSYGWFSSDKILIAQDSVYGNIEEGAYHFLIKYAEKMAEQLNQDNIQPNPEVLESIIQQDESMAFLAEGFEEEFKKQLAKAFRSEL